MHFNKNSFLLILLFSLPVDSFAATTVSVKIQVVQPVCIINNNQPILVEFGDVYTGKLDGVNYKSPIAYTLSCPGAEHLQFTMKLVDAGSAFDRSLFSSNNPDLGFGIEQNGSAVMPGQPFPFTFQNKPVLTIVPVKRAGATLKGGEFSAAYSMVISYQ